MVTHGICISLGFYPVTGYLCTSNGWTFTMDEFVAWSLMTTHLYTRHMHFIRLLSSHWLGICIYRMDGFELRTFGCDEEWSSGGCFWTQGSQLQIIDSTMDSHSTTLRRGYSDLNLYIKDTPSILFIKVSRKYDEPADGDSSWSVLHADTVAALPRTCRKP